MRSAASASAWSASAALTSFGQLLGVGQQGRPLVRARLADLLAERLLLAAQRVGARDGGAPGVVGGEQGVDEDSVGAAETLRGADAVRVVADELEVDHDIKAIDGPHAGCPQAADLPERVTA